MDESVIIVSDTASFLQYEGSGSIVGEITLVGNGWFYPEERWSDFPVVILAWWLRACQHVASRIGSTTLCNFMDGPYAFRLTSVNSTHWLVECMLKNGVGAAHSQEVTGKAFIENLLRVATSVLRKCDERGWKSKDIDELRLYVPSIN
jgi:hypothetical protein